MAIRYVVSVALMVALLSVAFVGVTQFAEDNSESQMEAEAAEIVETAERLYNNEEVPPPGQRGAQRQVTVTLPEDSLVSDPVEYFRVARQQDSVSTIEYRVDGGAKRQHQMPIPIKSGNRESLNLTGTGAAHELVFTLETDIEGNRVVNIRRATNEFQLVVNTEDGGAVRVNGTERQEWRQTYQWGDEVELTAVPDPGDDRWFAGWEGDVAQSLRSQTLNLTMNRDRNITVTFAEHALEVDVNHGSPDSEINAIVVEESGTGKTVSVEAYKSEGYLEVPQTFEADPDTEYTVRAYAMDMLLGEKTTSFEPGETGTVAIEAEPYVDVTYRILDNGTPVEGAKVQVRTHETDPDQLWRSKKTDSGGDATVRLQPSAIRDSDEYFEVTVLYEGSVVHEERLPYAEGGVREVDISDSD